MGPHPHGLRLRRPTRAGLPPVATLGPVGLPSQPVLHATRAPRLDELASDESIYSRCFDGERLVSYTDSIQGNHDRGRTHD